MADADSLFVGTPKHVQELFKRAKEARRAADRKKWVTANLPASPVVPAVLPPKR